MAMPEMQHASDSKHCRRCGAAYSYEAIYLGHLGRYRCPYCGQERPCTDGRAAEQITLDGTRGASFQLRTPDRSRSRSSCRSRASTTSTTRWEQRRCASSSSASPSTVVDGLAGVTAAFGRAERVRIGAHRAVDPAGQEPGRGQRDPAHASARARRARRARDPQRPHRRRPGRLLDMGRGLRAAGRRRRPGHVRWHARGRARSAPEVRRRRRRSASASWQTCRRRSTRPWRRLPRRRLFVLPTYTALLELAR